MRTIEIRGIEFPNAHEAIQWAEASGRGHAVHVWGKYLVVEREDADRLEVAGEEFAYQFDYEMPDGGSRFMTVPVN